MVKHGKPFDIFQELTNQYKIAKVFTNRDYEPSSRNRDFEIESLLKSKNIEFIALKDQVIFDHDDVLKKDGKPYTVFTPYSRQWKKLFNEQTIQKFPSVDFLNNLYRFQHKLKIPSLKELGFNEVAIDVPAQKIDLELLNQYHSLRDFPAKNGTSRLGIHLRFGTISIREISNLAAKHSEVFLNELIWRNFYMDILWHFPHVEHQSFKPKYDLIKWRNNEEEFDKWCEGQTGYPIVDAGMRELNTTGYMHNRVRMITASFLTKHLLIDWRWGEAYFANKLLDFELASNNGGWQWAAGSGCDAAPYFRVFNPTLQTQKFDPEGKYIKKWIPEIDTFNYPHPMVDHTFARKRAIEVYKKSLNG